MSTAAVASRCRRAPKLATLAAGLRRIWPHRGPAPSSGAGAGQHQRGRFLTSLKTEKIGYDADGRALYRLLKPLVYESARFGQIVVPSGFVTNFASVPRLPVVFLVAGGRAEEEATLHDFAYTVRHLARAECDALFLESLAAAKPYAAQRQKPTPAWLARLMWAGVRVGGASAYEGATSIEQPAHVRQLIRDPASQPAPA